MHDSALTTYSDNTVSHAEGSRPIHLQLPIPGSKTPFATLYVPRLSITQARLQSAYIMGTWPDQQNDAAPCGFRFTTL